MDGDQHRNHADREMTAALSISDVFRKHRRVCAWRGAGIGAFAGILVTGGMHLFLSSHPIQILGRRLVTCC
jgi:hypothetical protein